MKYGLLGYPLGHSLSPQIHSLLFSLAGRTQHRYVLYAREKPEDFGDVLKLDGFNVTIPYKTEIIRYLNQYDEKVARYRACNTVVRRGGLLYGYNTDVDGFLETLRSHQISLKDKKVLVTGFGGVSKMMVTEALLQGADVTVCLRNPAKQEETVKEVKQRTGKTIPVVTVPQNTYETILQGTPAGMYPNEISSPVPLISLKDIHFAFDTIYNPQSTLLTNAVEYAGGKGVNGLQMLVCQAAIAQKHFYGADFSRQQLEQVENKVRQQLKPLTLHKNIILIGPPGSGKSSVMKGIGRVFNLECYDLDQMIEIREGAEIKDIFAKKGESYFRRLEMDTALKLSEGNGKLLSTGGGIVETDACMEQLAANPDNMIVSMMPEKEILLSRLKGDKNRPLLAGNFEEKLSALLNRRMPLYRKYAHIPITIKEELPLKENVLKICDRIIAFLKK